MSTNAEVLPGAIAKTTEGVAVSSAAVASLDRRSPSRQGSRGNKMRFSPAIIARVVQFVDLLLLLLGGLLAKSMLAPLPWPRSDGSLFQAALIGTVVTLVSLRRSQAYLVRSLMPLGASLKNIYVAQAVGGACMMVTLFLTGDAGPGVRDWTVCWLIVCAFLLTASRSYLSRLATLKTSTARSNTRSSRPARNKSTPRAPKRF